MFEVLHCASSKIQLPDNMWSQTTKSSCFFSKYSRQFKCCKVGHFTSMKTISAKTASSGHSNKFGFWHQFFGLIFPPNAIELMHTYIKHGHLKNQDSIVHVYNQFPCHYFCFWLCSMLKRVDTPNAAL